MAFTPKYFDPKLLDLLVNIKGKIQQISDDLNNEALIIRSEIYTLGRTVQSLLSYCLPQEEEKAF